MKEPYYKHGISFGPFGTSMKRFHPMQKLWLCSKSLTYFCCTASRYHQRLVITSLWISQIKGTLIFLLYNLTVPVVWFVSFHGSSDLIKVLPVALVVLSVSVQSHGVTSLDVWVVRSWLFSQWSRLANISTAKWTIPLVWVLWCAVKGQLNESINKMI